MIQNIIFSVFLWKAIANYYVKRVRRSHNLHKTHIKANTRNNHSKKHIRINLHHNTSSKLVSQLNSCSENI